MDRDKAKALLPVLTALANGETIQANLHGIWVDRTNPEFDLPPECYRIAKPKEKIPLEAEDWIKYGPCWVRGLSVTGIGTISGIGVDCIVIRDASVSGCVYLWKDTLDLQRRNATSDWMPCWKEKE